MTQSMSAIAQGPIPLTPRFSIPSKLDSLLSRVDLLFGLFIATVTSYCAYHVVRCYQFISNPSFQLDNNLKVVKCKMLLDEVKAKLSNDATANVTPLLQQCEALQRSITDGPAFSPEQKTILRQLVEHYSKIDSQHAYQLALSLTADHDIFNATASIKHADPTFDRDQLSSLLQKVFQPTRILTKWALKYARAFHSLQKDEFTQQALARAKEFPSDWDTSTKVQALCDIAITYKKLGDLTEFESFMKHAQQLCSLITPPTDCIRAHLALANTLFSYQEYEKMDEVLAVVFAKVTSLPLSQTQKEACSLAMLLKKISTTDEVSSKFKNVRADYIINKAFEDLGRLIIPNAEKRAEIYLAFASAYDQLEMQDEKQIALRYAMQAIESLPESTATEIESKFDLLETVSFFKQVPSDLQKKVLQLLEKHYSQSTFHDLSSDKQTIAGMILGFCNNNNLTEESKTFFNSYLSDIKNQKKDASGKIITLALQAGLRVDNLNLEQRKLMLEAAEGFISKVPSHSYAHLISLIVNAYRKVGNRQKSQELLNNYARRQAVGYLGSAAILPIVLGILHVYPQSAPYLSAGFAAYHIIQMPRSF
jgi:hypothetical protein